MILIILFALGTIFGIVTTMFFTKFDIIIEQKQFVPVKLKPELYHHKHNLEQTQTTPKSTHVASVTGHESGYKLEEITRPMRPLAIKKHKGIESLSFTIEPEIVVPATIPPQNNIKQFKEVTATYGIADEKFSNSTRKKTTTKPQFAIQNLNSKEENSKITTSSSSEDHWSK